MINDLFLLEPGSLNAITRLMSSPDALSRLGPDSFEPVGLDCYSVRGACAYIEARGVLTRDPSWFAYYVMGGNTTYKQIIDGIAQANADPMVAEVEIDLDSPGGSISGMFEAMEAIANSQKPVRVVGYNMVASAAYGLASQADTFYLANKATRVGSVGIVTQVAVDNDRVVTIASSNAPNKRPDASTDEGKAQIRAELDDIEDLFIEAIAAGREVTASEVRKNYGRGGVLLAAEAVKRGMADGVLNATSQPTNHNQTPGATADRATERAESMNLEKLKADHPELYAEVIAKGQTEERDRVSAHLELAEGSGDMTAAITAIKEGSQVTQAIMAKHLKASMTRNEQAAAVADNAAAEAADTDTGAESKDFNAQVADQLAALLGDHDHE